MTETATLAMERTTAALEALLIMATEPLSSTQLGLSLGIDPDQIDRLLTELADFYVQTGRGFELRRLGAGWRYYTRPDLADVIGASVLAGQHGRLTQAGLETLAVIAYLQPISRSRISAIRGVNVDGVVRTLLARDLVVESGQDKVTGAGLLSTTDFFLERMGLTGLDQLPPLAPNLPDAAALEAELALTVSQSIGVELAVADPAGPVESAEAAVDDATVGPLVERSAADPLPVVEGEDR